MSDYYDIQTLLEKYWEGETTLEEERRIKGYFASGVVDERLRKFTPMFQAFREEQAVQLNKAKVVPIRPQMYWAAAASVAVLLAVGLWWLFSKPADAIIVADKNSPVEQIKSLPDKVAEPENTAVVQAQPAPVRRTSHPKRILVNQEITPAVNAEEVAAMEEIKAALALVSSKIRKGRQEVAKGAIHLETMDKIFKRKEG